MTASTVRGLVATVPLVAVAVAIAAPAPAMPGGSAAAAARITPKGVGKVRLGRTHASLKRAGLVGPQRPGCELGGPGTRGAKLRAPLKGAVDLTRKDPRRVRSILVTGGAKARGVGIGSTEADIRSAYPKAKFDKSTQEVFAITLVKVPKNGGGRLQFALDEDKDRVTLIGVPFIAFCE